MLLNVGKQIMRLWQQAVHANEKRLRYFAGWWTTENVCSFPPDDEEVAASYVLAVNEYTKLAGNPPRSVEERDWIYTHCFRNTRRFPLVRVAEEALELLRTAAEKSCDREGIDASQLEDILTKRAVKAQSNSRGSNLDSALIFLDAKMTLVFDVLRDGDGREDFDIEMACPEESATPLWWVKFRAADV